MKILGIETSCDETAAAIVEDGIKLISASLATSRELHEKTGGVVPEVAARKQVESIIPVIDDCVSKSGLSSIDIDAVAVTIGPGLLGSLVVGVAAAKALAFAWNKPLIPVNHLVGHIYANFINVETMPVFPALALVVSGGHTDLVLLTAHGKMQYLGGTLDDAAGEAFDKTARLLGLQSYLGGPILSQRASECTQNTLLGKLPRPKIHDHDYDFSFSGLKTAVKRLYEAEHPPVDVIACEFETAVVDVLVTKTIKAAQAFNVKTILLGGGVAANKPLRSRLQDAAATIKIPVSIPAINLCMDTAIYIAGAAYFTGRRIDISDFDLIQPDPSLGITD